MRQQLREAERERRDDAAARKAAEREAKQTAVAAGKDEAARRTDGINDVVELLSTILSRGLGRPPRFDLASMFRHDEMPPLDLGVRGRPAPPPRWDNLAPQEPGALSAVFGGRSRYEARLATARVWFDEARAAYDRDEGARQRWVREERERHQRASVEQACEVREHNDRIEALRAGLASRDRASVEAYLQLVLDRTLLPIDVPHRAEVAYSPRGEPAVVRSELPSPDAVPTVSAYTYVPTTGETKGKTRAATEVKKMYRSVVSQMALLYMRDLLETDPALENLELAGHVHAINPATGHRDYPCLISMGVDRERFEGLHLRDVTPGACLTYLNALVSRHPHAVEPVTPVRDFDLARYSFVEGVDVVAASIHAPISRG